MHEIALLLEAKDVPAKLIGMLTREPSTVAANKAA